MTMMYRFRVDILSAFILFILQLTACDIASTKQLLDKIKDHGGAVAGKVKELTEMISSSESVSTELVRTSLS